MGVSTDGILAYGFDLGGEEGEGGWKVREAGKYGDLELPWADPESGDWDGFGDAAVRRLLTAAGFTETYEDGRDGYFTRKSAAERGLGVEIESYCSGDFPMYLLAAQVITVNRGSVIDVGPVMAAADETVRQEWDASLARAISALGLTPLQEKPAWLLASYWN